MGVENIGRRNPQLEQKVELGDRSDLESGAFLEHELEHAWIRVRLDRVVRPHARHRRREATSLLSDDGGIDQKERLVVAVFDCRPDFLEIQARLGGRVEEMGCFERLLSDGSDGFFSYACTHLHRLASLGRTYVTGMSSAKKSCEPQCSLLLVMMTSFVRDLQFKSDLQKHRARV